MLMACLLMSFLHVCDRSIRYAIGGSLGKSKAELLELLQFLMPQVGLSILDF
jgi:hypothetical protein